MGVNILPKFAPMVCIATTGIIYSLLSTMERIIKEKGRNCDNATSFVINILEKKHKNIKLAHNDRVFFT